jgi:hypothetical protein
MKNLGKILAVGAACSACLVVPAIIGLVGGTGLAASGISIAAGWMTWETLLCVAIPFALVAGFLLYQVRQKKADAAACTVDGSCGCSGSKLAIEDRH